MKSLLINHTNHPYALWSQAQKEYTSGHYRDVVDMAFPNIDPVLTTTEVYQMVCDYQHAISTTYDGYDILISGEMTYVYQFVKEAISKGVLCMCATTERRVSEQADGTTVRYFEFIKYRPYETI